MDKEDKQIIDRATKEEWRIGDRTRLKRLLEKNLKLYRENVELENKIADIKANCDLAIEGRDIKIKELEQKLEQTEKDLADYQFNYPKIKELQQENAELKKWQKDTIKARGNDYMDWSRMKDQLTKATEFLKEVQGYIENIDDVLYDEAEQFLKEIEK